MEEQDPDDPEPGDKDVDVNVTGPIAGHEEYGEGGDLPEIEEVGKCSDVHKVHHHYNSNIATDALSNFPGSSKQETEAGTEDNEDYKLRDSVDNSDYLKLVLNNPDAPNQPKGNFGWSKKRFENSDEASFLARRLRSTHFLGISCM